MSTATYTTTAAFREAIAADDPWQLLAMAVNDQPLNVAQVEVTRSVPATTALAVLFPELDDAARQEFLWAIGG
jgi:hypothetical protein